jgi:hypothetical protein
VAEKGKVAELEAKPIHLGDVEANMFLFFFEGMGDAAPKGFWGMGESGEGVSHNFDGEEFVSGKTVETDCAMICAVVSVERGKFLFFRVFGKAHADGAGGFGEKKGSPGLEIGEKVGAKELFFEGVRSEDAGRPVSQFHYSTLRTK